MLSNSKRPKLESDRDLSRNLKTASRPNIKTEEREEDKLMEVKLEPAASPEIKIEVKTEIKEEFPDVSDDYLEFHKDDLEDRVASRIDLEDRVASRIDQISRFLASTSTVNPVRSELSGMKKELTNESSGTSGLDPTCFASYSPDEDQVSISEPTPDTVSIPLSIMPSSKSNRKRSILEESNPKPSKKLRESSHSTSKTEKEKCKEVDFHEDDVDNCSPNSGSPVEDEIAPIPISCVIKLKVKFPSAQFHKGDNIKPDSTRTGTVNPSSTDPSKVSSTKTQPVKKTLVVTSSQKIQVPKKVPDSSTAPSWEKELLETMKNEDMTSFRVILARHKEELGRDEWKMSTSPLYWAVDQGSIMCISRLVHAGVKINSWIVDDDKGHQSKFTALHWAAHRNQETVVDILLPLGADVTAEGRWKKELEGTPRDWALKSKSRSIEKQLAEVSCPKQLCNAVERDDIKTLRTILAWSKVTLITPPRVNSFPNRCWLVENSPLHCAARFCSSEMVRALVSAGIDINHCDGEGKSALDVAVEYAYRETNVVKLLLDLGADPAVGKALITVYTDNNTELIQMFEDAQERLKAEKGNSQKQPAREVQSHEDVTKALQVQKEIDKVLKEVSALDKKRVKLLDKIAGFQADKKYRTFVELNKTNK